jgi:protein tyrosine phosphatase
MQVITTMNEFIEYNKENWAGYWEFDEKGNKYIQIYNPDIHNGKSATIYTDMIIGICIESNQLCIAFKNKIMIWFDGSSGSLSIDTTDINNPLFKE